LDVVAEIPLARGLSAADARRRARQLLLRLNIPERFHSLPPATFSGGEQQRVNLARGFIAEHPILLLYEPTASLDAGNCRVVIDMIREAKAKGCAILTNVVLVLPHETLAGTIVLHGSAIAAIDPGRSAEPNALDMDGDYIVPGVVDVHTDNLERQVQPRSLARWPSRSAMVAHDAQCAAAGITTVLDALCLGDLGFDKERIRTFREGVIDLGALSGTGLLKADHFMHLRCEVPATDMLGLFDSVADHPLVRMVSLMDHSPGVGQYA